MWAAVSGAPIPHPERAMAAGFLPLCPSHVPLVKAMCTKLGKEKYVFHKNASVHEHIILIFALVSSHVCYVALLFSLRALTMERRRKRGHRHCAEAACSH